MSALPDIWSGLTLGMALGVTRWGAAWLRPFVTGTAVTGLVSWLLIGRPEDAGLCGAALVVLGWDWRNRKGRKVVRALGHKARAALAAIVERAREAGSPLPEGAKA